MIRFHCEDSLEAGVAIRLSPEQAHHARTVLRSSVGTRIHLFNARDGEWWGTLGVDGRRLEVRLAERFAPPAVTAGPWLLFCPVKRQATDLIVEKATELGATGLCPVLSRRTQADRVNPDRLRAVATGAAEQCGRLDVPALLPPMKLETLPAAMAAGDLPLDRLVWGDERGNGQGVGAACGTAPCDRLGLLIGPAGGFDDAERDLLAASDRAVAVDLGPRILRAETAAIALLALVQAHYGGWG